MPPKELRVLGIDPGGTTGWALLIIPRKSIYGDEPSKIIDWDYGQLTGDEDKQVDDLCELIRTFQGLDYKIGPGCAVEDFEMMSKNRDSEVLLSPVRIAAKLRYALHLGKCGDAKIVMQNRALAKSTVTDDRLKRWGFWIPGKEHARDGMRHALTAVRRAAANERFRDSLWNYLID